MCITSTLLGKVPSGLISICLPSWNEPPLYSLRLCCRLPLDRLWRCSLLLTSLFQAPVCWPQSVCAQRPSPARQDWSAEGGPPDLCLMKDCHMGPLWRSRVNLIWFLAPLRSHRSFSLAAIIRRRHLLLSTGTGSDLFLWWGVQGPFKAAQGEGRLS